jgi:hypothetical protein
MEELPLRRTKYACCQDGEARQRVSRDRELIAQVAQMVGICKNTSAVIFEFLNFYGFR